MARSGSEKNLKGKWMNSSAVWETLENGLIVSCQARKGQPFDDPELLVKTALAAYEGGAVGIRANTPTTITKIRNAVPLPVIGINKKRVSGRHVFITPDYEDAVAVAETGAEILGIECTFQDDRQETLPAIVERLHKHFPCLLMADIATYEEARFAEEIGFDLVATTLVGYTGSTPVIRGFDFQLLDQLAATLEIPVIAEGHLRTPVEAAETIRHGAFAVVVGKAITMPSEITRWFVEALHG
jgi:N-acylglucosamine-6-phosphate 2-epimerase